MNEICRVYYHLLSEEEQQSCDLQSYQRDVAGKMLARGFLEFFQAEYRPEEIRREAGGKPYDVSCPSRYFNISHCRQAVAAAVAHCPVGIDTEGMRRVNFRTAKKSCGRKELNYVLQDVEAAAVEKKEYLSPEETERFLRLWTLKESYVKMTGEGIRMALDQVCVCLPESEEIKDHMRWQRTGDEIFSCLHMEETCMMALTLRQQNMKSEAVSWISF